MMAPTLTPIRYFGQREQILPDLLQIVSHGRGPYKNLFDPFSGSGSVSFAAMQAHAAECYHINDSTPVLHSLWESVKAKAGMLITEYEKHLNQYVSLPEEGRRAYYQDCLNKFNQSMSQGGKDDAALLFPFLINHASDNMPLFNSSFQLVSRPNVTITKQQAENDINEFTKRVYTVSRLLNENKSDASSGDFTECIKNAASGDLVIFDPPYPAQSGSIYYNPKSEEELWEHLRVSFSLLNQRGVNFIILYGANAVSLSRQFTEPGLQLQHLIRLSYHPIYQHYLEHVYVSSQLRLTDENLPHGMVPYASLFETGKEMSEEQCNAALDTLKAKFGVLDKTTPHPSMKVQL